jgi:plasmid stability protein
MPTITIRNLPEDVVRKLKDSAKRHNRSMEQEVRCILTEAVPDREEAMRRIEALRQQFLRQPSAEEVQEWAREARRWRGR